MPNFIDYVLSFYGPEGLYPMGATADQVIRATAEHISSGADYCGDSFDRENVRDILIRRFGLIFPS